ncbi:MAG: hypothetical protein Kow0090_20660 [Myxococcota bacterium]
MKNRPILLKALLFFLVCLSLPLTADGNEKPLNFALKDTGGKTVKLSDYVGRDVIVVVFWATWCSSCIQELDALKKIYYKFSGKGLTVLAINIDDESSPAAVKSFVESKGYPFTILLDPETKVISRYQPSMVTPYMVVIDREGFIAEKHEAFGADDAQKLEALLESLLSERATGTAPPLLEPERPATGVIPPCHIAKPSPAGHPQAQVNGELYISPSLRKMMATVGMSADEAPYLLNLKNRAIVDGRYSGFSANLLVNDAHFFPLYQYRWMIDDVTILDETANEYISVPLPRKEPMGNLVTLPRDTIELEKISVSYSDEEGRVGVTAGDFYGFIARGLGLSLRRRDLDGEDTTVRGVKGSVAFPSETSITAMGGIVNPLPYVGLEDRLRNESDAKLAGGVLEQRLPFEIAELGFFGFASRFDAEIGDLCLGNGGDKTDTYRWFGGMFEILPGGKYITLNGAFSQRGLNSIARCNKFSDDPALDESLQEKFRDDLRFDQDGFGAFGEVNGFVGPVTLIAAAKKYEHYYIYDPANSEADAVHLIEPPSFEPEYQEISQNRDVWGGMGGARVAFLNNLNGSFYFNRMAYTEREELHEVSYQGWTDWQYSGNVLRFLRTELAFRRESKVKPETGKRFIGHTDLDLILDTTIAVSAKNELRPNAVFSRQMINTLGPVEEGKEYFETYFNELQADLGYLYTRKYGINLHYGYSTRRDPEGKHYPAASLVWRPDNMLILRLLAGSMYGGRRCVGGVCRDLPDFEGVKLEFTSRF